MKRIVCIAIWALAFLSAGFLFAARAGKPRSENAPSPETEQPAAENAQESESSVPSQEGVQEEAAPKAEPAREKPRRGWGGPACRHVSSQRIGNQLAQYTSFFVEHRCNKSDYNLPETTFVWTYSTEIFTTHGFDITVN